MFVLVEVLDARDSLAGLGTDPRDHIVLRAGLPPSPRSKMATPVQLVAAPILGQQAGIAVPPQVASDIKHELTKRVNLRTLDKYLVRLLVTQHGKWVGTVFVRLMCLANGYVVERWVHMKPANGVAPGALKIRLVVRDSEAAARAVFSETQSVEPNAMSRTEGCECDVCDPYGELYDPVAKKAQNDKYAKGVGVIAFNCVIC